MIIQARHFCLTRTTSYHVVAKKRPQPQAQAPNKRLPEEDCLNYQTAGIPRLASTIYLLSISYLATKHHIYSCHTCARYMIEIELKRDRMRYIIDTEKCSRDNAC